MTYTSVFSGTLNPAQSINLWFLLPWPKLKLLKMLKLCWYHFVGLIKRKNCIDFKW